MDEQKKSKLYTGRGDKGKTSLVGGKRVSKASPRLNAYGQLDELNSFIGLCRMEHPLEAYDQSHGILRQRDTGVAAELLQTLPVGSRHLLVKREWCVRLEVVYRDVDVHLTTQAARSGPFTDLLLQRTQVTRYMDIDIRILAIYGVDLHGDLLSLTALLRSTVAGH